MSGQSKADDKTKSASKQSPTGSDQGISQQKGGDLAPDPAHKATEDSGKLVNENRQERAK